MLYVAVFIMPFPQTYGRLMVEAALKSLEDHPVPMPTQSAQRQPVSPRTLRTALWISNIENRHELLNLDTGMIVLESRGAIVEIRGHRDDRFDMTGTGDGGAEMADPADGKFDMTESGECGDEMTLPADGDDRVETRGLEYSDGIFGMAGSGDDSVEMTGPEDRAEMTRPEERVDMTGPEDRAEMTGPEDRAEMTGPEDRVEVTGLEDRAEMTRPERVEMTGPEDIVEMTGPEDRAEMTRPERFEMAGLEDRVEMTGPEDRGVEMTGPEDRVEMPGPEDRAEMTRPEIEMTGHEDRVEMTGPEDIVEMTGPEDRAEMTRPERVDMTGPEDRVEMTGPEDRVEMTGPEDRAEMTRPERVEMTGPGDRVEVTGPATEDVGVVITEPGGRGKKRRQWKTTLEKQKRMRGEAYEGKKYDHVKKSNTTLTRPPKKLQKRCVHTANHETECWQLSEEDRLSIFQRFWTQSDWQQRRQYVCSLVDSVDKQRKTVCQSRRMRSLKYFLKLGEKRVRVCAHMFSATLVVPRRTVLNWIGDAEHSLPTSPIYAKKKKLKETCQNRANKRILAKAFLTQLDKVPSHYCRKSSTKNYLWPGDFPSSADIHRRYTEWLSKNHPDESPASLTTMKEILESENIKIFQPRKDQCDLCVSYKQGNIGEDVYNQHVENKNEARFSKERDKEEAKENADCLVITVDVEAVQNIPKTEASCLYFKTRLNLHNYTFYNVTSGDVVCYVWPETEGGLTANVFSSCLIDYLDRSRNKYPGLRKLTIWSDGCASQNRNATLASAISAWALKYSVTCYHKYLIKGHTQMEVDSVHAKIESRLKRQDLEVPADYCRIIKEARKSPNPYTFIYLDHTFFKNYEVDQAYDSIRPGFRTGDPCVNDIRQLCYRTDGSIEYRLTHKEGDVFTLLPQRRRKSLAATLPPLYLGPIPLSARKFKDLQDMKVVLHPSNHFFYDNLPHL